MNTSDNKQEKNKVLEANELEDVNGGIYTLAKDKRQDGFRGSYSFKTNAGQENEIIE